MLIYMTDESGQLVGAGIAGQVDLVKALTGAGDLQEQARRADERRVLAAGGDALRRESGGDFGQDGLKARRRKKKGGGAHLVDLNGKPKPVRLRGRETFSKSIRAIKNELLAMNRALTEGDRRARR